MEKICDLFESVKMTIVGGVFLALSFTLSLYDLNLVFDPAWITVIISGLPILYSAIKKLIKNRGISKISSALLISTAMIAAILIGDLFAAGEVAFIMAIGEILEHKTTAKAKKGLKKLIGLAPTTARLIKDGNKAMISAEKIKAGDILRILPGETIPVDGVIISGETSVDQSVMTGESLPVDKGINDDVFGGTINRFGAIDIKATKVGEDSSLSLLIRMVKDAENKKAPMQRTADKWASWLVPVAFLIAVITYIITADIVRAVTVLVVFCPCALVLATPTAIMAAIGQATKHGVIIKSGEALEKMGKVNTIAFDKTGTLTYGRLTVSDIVTTENISAEELLYLVSSAELKSEHPLGKAIVEYAKDKVKTAEPEEFKMEAGKGVFAKIDGEEILCGNEKYLFQENINLNDEIKNTEDALRNEGKALVLVAKNSECVGIIALSDVLKEDGSKVIDKLSKMKTEAVLLTGDNKKAASFFAAKTGIKKIFAELLPEEKVSQILQMQKHEKVVAMIGDGVNDAPALKTADVGIAMAGLGSDIAVEAADIALMSDDIAKIPYLKRLSNETLKTIKFSIFLSLFINFLAIILSFFGVLTPTTGALVHNAGACFVVLIAAMLYDRNF